MSEQPGKVVLAHASVLKNTNPCAAVTVSSTPTSVTSTAATAVSVSLRMPFHSPYHSNPQPPPSSFSLFVFLFQILFWIVSCHSSKSTHISAHSTGLKPFKARGGSTVDDLFSFSSDSLSSNADDLLNVRMRWNVEPKLLFRNKKKT